MGTYSSLTSAFLIVFVFIFITPYASAENNVDRKYDLKAFEGFEEDENGVFPPMKIKSEVNQSVNDDGSTTSTSKSIQCLVSNPERCVVVETKSTKFLNGKEKVYERVFKSDSNGDAL